MIRQTMTIYRMVRMMISYLDIMTLHDCIVWQAYGYEFIIENGHITAIEKAATPASESDQ
jgi:hypothetical protein